MLTALSTVVPTSVLFSRKGNENAPTAGSPVGPYIPGAVDMEETQLFCVSFDNDMLVLGPVYYVAEVELPEWLSAKEWASTHIKWKYTWGQGVKKEWPEAWQRGLLEFSSAETLACAKLLATKKFRSSFRESLRDQLVVWLETPAEERKFNSPFSPRQWACLMSHRVYRAAEQTDNRLYWS